MSSVASRAVRNSTGVLLAVGAQPPAHLEAVEVGQHHVEDDQVGAAPRHRVERVAAGRRRVHVEADVAQRGLEHRAQVLLVVDEEESFTGHDRQRRRRT